MSLRRLHKRISIHIHTVTFQTDKCRYSRSPNSKDRKHEQRACEMKYKCRDWPSFEANPFISSYSWDVSSWVFLRDLKLNIPQTKPIPFSQASVPSSSFHIPGQSMAGTSRSQNSPIPSLFLYLVGGPVLQRRDSWNKVSKPLQQLRLETS